MYYIVQSFQQALDYIKSNEDSSGFSDYQKILTKYIPVMLQWFYHRIVETAIQTSRNSRNDPFPADKGHKDISHMDISLQYAIVQWRVMANKHTKGFNYRKFNISGMMVQK